MDSLRKNAPDRWTLVSAHGKWVGLNESDMGNSEVTPQIATSDCDSRFNTLEKA